MHGHQENRFGVFESGFFALAHGLRVICEEQIQGAALGLVEERGDAHFPERGPVEGVYRLEEFEEEGAEQGGAGLLEIVGAVEELSAGVAKSADERKGLLAVHAGHAHDFI